MNRPNIQYAAQKLEGEGKIKRQKIKARYKNGNLNSVWLLTLPEVKYEEILEYEMELVNRPYESPLKIHHCYKSKDDNTKSDITDEETQPPTNVISLNDYVKINNQDLNIKEYKNHRVITAYDIAKLHKKNNSQVNQQFKRNKKHFIKNVDYFEISTQTFKSLMVIQDFIPNNVENIKLFTESGYLMLVKSFKDDLAWDVQRKLVEGYFRLKEISNTPAAQEALPQMKIDTLDMFEVLIKEMKNQRSRVAEQDSKIIELENKFEALRSALG